MHAPGSRFISLHGKQMTRGVQQVGTWPLGTAAIPRSADTAHAASISAGTRAAAQRPRRRLPRCLWFAQGSERAAAGPLEAKAAFAAGCGGADADSA